MILMAPPGVLGFVVSVLGSQIFLTKMSLPYVYVVLSPIDRGILRPLWMRGSCSALALEQFLHRPIEFPAGPQTGHSLSKSPEADQRQILLLVIILKAPPWGVFVECSGESSVFCVLHALSIS